MSSPRFGFTWSESGSGLYATPATSAGKRRFMSASAASFDTYLTPFWSTYWFCCSCAASVFFCWIVAFGPK